MFWISFPQNTFKNNAAVGGAFGFWYSLSEHPVGFAETPTNSKLEWPRLESQYGSFQGNTAHSSTNCLFVDRGAASDGTVDELTPYTPKAWALDPSAVSLDHKDIEDFIQAGSVVPVFFNDVTAYKCRLHALWFRGTGFVVKNAKVTDSFLMLTMPG